MFMHYSYKIDLFSLCESVPEITIIFNIPDNHHRCFIMCILIHIMHLYINTY